MEQAQTKKTNQTTIMGEEDKPPVIDSVEYFPALGSTEGTPSSPPKPKRLLRKADDITTTPDRANKTNSTPTINHVTPTAVGPGSSRINKDPKKMKNQQSLFAFMANRRASKDQITERTVVGQVKTTRLENGRRLVPAGEKQRLLHEKAKQSRKEAEEAAQREEGMADAPQKSIKFSKGSGGTKPTNPTKSVLKSALKKGPKKPIKIYKYELVVTVKLRVSYERKKNQVRKKVYVSLNDAITLMKEGGTDVAFLGKGGRKSTIPPIRTLTDFPTTAYALKQDYACVPNTFAFTDAKQGTSKVVELCMIIGMDEEIVPTLEAWEMDLAEKGIEIKEKKCQLLNTHDKHMILGCPTSLPPSLVARQCKAAFEEAEKKIREDKQGLYDQSLHATKEPLEFAILKRYPTGMPWVVIKEGENRPDSGRMVFVIQIKAEQEPRLRQILTELKDTSRLGIYLGKHAWTMVMQVPVREGDDMATKQMKNKTIDGVCAHGSFQLSLGHTIVPGMRNAEKVHRLKQLTKTGSTIKLKKTMAGILQYLQWEEDKVFQSVWTMEDGTAMVFFSNVIKDIETYVMNWTTCPAANIYYFLMRKGCDGDDVHKMLKECFSPDELVKIKNVSLNGPMAVLKEKVNIDMTAVVQNSKLFDMNRGLTKEEKLSKVQQAAVSNIQFGVATHGALGAFNFETDNDDVKTVTTGKKVGERASGSVSGETFAEDVFSVAGNTTKPDYQNEAEEVDSFASSMDTTWKPEEEDGNKNGQNVVDLTNSNNKMVIDMSGMDDDQGIDTTMKAAKDDMSLELEEKNKEGQTTDDKANNEADTAGGSKTSSGSFGKECNTEQDKRHDNKVDQAHTFLDQLWNDKGPSPEAMTLACRDIKEHMVHARDEEGIFMQVEGYSDDLIQSLKKEKDSITELIEFMEDTITNIQAYMQAEVKEGEEEKDGEKEAGKTETEKNGAEEDNEMFVDAKDDESIDSMTNEIKTTNKTQRTASNSQHGAAKDAVPHPVTKEGGQEVTAAPGHGDG